MSQALGYLRDSHPFRHYTCSCKWRCAAPEHQALRVSGRRSVNFILRKSSEIAVLATRR